MQILESFERSSTITTKGQVTIPVQIRRALGVGPHDRVAFVVEDNQVHLRPSRGVVARTSAALRRYFPKQPLSAEEERASFEAGVGQLEAIRSFHRGHDRISGVKRAEL